MSKKNPGGRPTKYSKQLADEICLRISEDEPLTAICESPHLPTRQTVYNWLKDHSGFFDSYEKARKYQADATFDGIIAIEDLVMSGCMDAARARVLIDSKKWRAAKMRSDLYGDKQSVESSVVVQYTPDTITKPTNAGK